MALNELEIIDAVSFEIKDSQGQFRPAIRRKMRHVLRAILRAYDWPWAVRTVMPDLIPQGNPPRILLPIDFNELLDDGVIPVLAGDTSYYTNRWGAPGRVIHDTWACSVTQWPYYTGGNSQGNSSAYGYDREPLGPWYNRVAVSPENYLHFLEPSNHAYRVNYQAIPDISAWPEEFENIIISEISARMQIPLEGDDLITSRAEFALAKADLNSLINQYAEADQGDHREASRYEKLRYRAGYLSGFVAPIAVPVLVPVINAITPTIARPGEIASVSGANLNVIDVFFLNGNPTQLVNITPSTAQFTIPPLSAGTYTTTLSYMGSGGNVIVAPPVTILDVPQPAAITALSGADWDAATATASVVSEVRLTGRGLEGVTQFRAGDIVLAADNLGTANPSVYFPVAPGTYSLVGITPNGRTTPYTITVRAYPVVPLPAPTLADILFDREGLNGRPPSDPLTENRYYAAGLPSNFSFKYYIVPVNDVASSVAGRGIQNSASTYSQIYQHSNPRYESRHARVEVSNTITQYFSRSQNKWILVNDFQMRGAAFVEDFSGNAATGADQFEYPDGRWTFRAGTNARGEAGTLSNRLIDFDERGPKQAVGFNFHGFDFRYDIPWADAECVLAYSFMRAVGPGSEGSIPPYVANIGIDSWKSRDSDFDGFQTHGGVNGGRLKPVTGLWQCFTCFVGPVARLTASPPLGFAGGGNVAVAPTITSTFAATNQVGATITLVGTKLELITTYRLGQAAVTLSPTTEINVTSRTFVIPLLPPNTYPTSYEYTGGDASVTGASIVVVQAPAPTDAIPTITGFSGADWNAANNSGSTLSELRVLGTNLNVITAFKTGNILLSSDGIGTTAPSIYLPAIPGQIAAYGEFPGGTTAPITVVTQDPMTPPTTPPNTGPFVVVSYAPSSAEQGGFVTFSYTGLLPANLVGDTSFSGYKAVTDITPTTFRLGVSGTAGAGQHIALSTNGGTTTIYERFDLGITAPALIVYPQVGSQGLSFTAAQVNAAIDFDLAGIHGPTPLDGNVGRAYPTGVPAGYSWYGRGDTDLDLQAHLAPQIGLLTRGSGYNQVYNLVTDPNSPVRPSILNARVEMSRMYVAFYSISQSQWIEKFYGTSVGSPFGEDFQEFPSDAPDSRNEVDGRISVRPGLPLSNPPRFLANGMRIGSLYHGFSAGSRFLINWTDVLSMVTLQAMRLIPNSGTDFTDVNTLPYMADMGYDSWQGEFGGAGIAGSQARFKRVMPTWQVFTSFSGLPNVPRPGGINFNLLTNPRI